MEIFPNGTAKAAAGPWFNCTEGDVLWTSYAIDEDCMFTPPPPFLIALEKRATNTSPYR
jgi:hypothetical protein